MALPFCFWFFEHSLCVLCAALFTVLLCYFAETLNTLAREHWELFSTQQYFDKTGVFTSLVFSAPLILIALVILVRPRTFLASLPVAICARICAC
jgi:hypothetical protein